MRLQPKPPPAPPPASMRCIDIRSRRCRPNALGRVTLTTGATMPFDRAYAIENGPGRFDAQAPRHLPKVTFLTLMRDERAATLDTTFDDATETLTISRGGKQVARGQLTTKLGRTLIEQFLAAYMKAELRERRASSPRRATASPTSRPSACI